MARIARCEMSAASAAWRIDTFDPVHLILLYPCPLKRRMSESVNQSEQSNCIIAPGASNGGALPLTAAQNKGQPRERRVGFQFEFGAALIVKIDSR